MDGEPRNAASDQSAELVSSMNVVDVEGYRDIYTDDFIRVDRRSMVALPTSNADELAEQQKAWFELGAGRPTFSQERVLAVRGDRCLVNHVRIAFDTGYASEMLHALRFDKQVRRVERMVSFDLDDVEAALAELDRLHGEIVAGA